MQELQQDLLRVQELEEHGQRSTSKSAPTEQNKSAVTEHAISLNHVIDWDRAKVIDRESNRMDQRRITEAMYIRKEQDKPMNQVLQTFPYL